VINRSQRGDAVFDQGVHAVAMKPKQPHRELPQIVARWTHGQLACPTQSVGSLFFNMRSLMYHRPL
jgi:hypothetical protein